jgi:putative FmdB family regulatory protein
MPLYEYKCHSCGETFEIIQKFSDTPLTAHEKCGSGPVERLISTSALNFKGTGWYVTDYARSGNGKNKESKEAKEAKDDKKASSKAGDAPSGDSSAKSETKTATTTTPASTSDKSDKKV